ncbi:hypothetical protein [Micromonospora sp. C95]|uniref:hypothetical protein n=1 Tax=Micromonospora sp. C95 TaxID=2824882 RepID=UPI001B376F24|nr:hypothetical protein [Micromonospora sp. C95]MBQ1025908.1 hypothetical protein [Micromonospora sp. C95]
MGPIGGTLVGWLVEAGATWASRRGLTLLLGDEQQRELRGVVRRALEETARVVPATMDPATRAELPRILAEHSSPIDRPELLEVANLPEALRTWFARFDEPPVDGGDGFLAAHGISVDDLVAEMARQIRHEIDQAGLTGGGLAPIADWLWKQDLMASVEAALRALPSGELPLDPVELAVALDSYLSWVIRLHRRLRIPGLQGQRGVVEVPLAQVYVALRVDPTSPSERAAAQQMLLRDLEEIVQSSDHTPEQESRLLWLLQADLPVADHLATAERLARFRGERDALLNIAELHEHSSQVVVLGDPGSGKTTIMRWLALMHAYALRDHAAEVRVPVSKIDASRTGESAVVSLGPPLLPVLVRIAEYAEWRQRRADGQTLLLDFLAELSWLGSTAPWTNDCGEHRVGTAIPTRLRRELVQRALSEQRALIMIDGLDEVSDPRERVEISEAVTEFLRVWSRPESDQIQAPGPGNKMVVTSRIAGYHLRPLPAAITHVTVERMTDETVAVFMRTWMREVGAILHGESSSGWVTTDSDEQADRLLELLGAPEGRYVRELATNPLLAGTIATIYHTERGQLPRQRVEVYQKAVDRLVDLWYERLSRAEVDRLRGHMFAVLRAVAYHVHRHKPSGVIAEPEFRDVFRQELARLRPDAVEEMLESLLRAMRDEVGLLASSAPGAYRFSHLTFQEFLAAQHLITRSDGGAGAILEHLGDPRWQEPILMLIALVNWQQKSKMPELVQALLDASGRLGTLFPESALLLAGAIAQMTDVADATVQAVLRRLLTSYRDLILLGRLPQARRLIEEAIRRLRAGEHLSVVDATLADALINPVDGAESAGTIARLVRAVEIATPEIADALHRAASRWDSEELGFPIAEALTLVVSPDPKSGPRVDPNAILRVLPMRMALRRDSALVARIRQDRRWLALITALFGGYADLDARTHLYQFRQMVNYLQLDDHLRDAFLGYFGRIWGRDDPVYAMAVHLDRSGEEESKRAAEPPVFTPDSITRDSPLRREILTALRRDDLPGLVDRLGQEASAPDDERRAEAVVALWALGRDVSQRVAGDPVAAAALRRRAGVLSVTLRDAALRAAGTGSEALTAAARQLPVRLWENLLDAVIAVSLQAGAEPITLDVRKLPVRTRRKATVEEIAARRFGGYGKDRAYLAATFLDVGVRAGLSPGALIGAMNDLGSARHTDYSLNGHSWPADPLAFAHRDLWDVPTTVLDMLVRVPEHFVFARSWALGSVLPKVVAGNPRLVPEVLAVTLGETVDRHRSTSRYDPTLNESDDPVEHVRRLAHAVADPWHRARALARLAEACVDRRAELAREAGLACAELIDPSQAFQLHEWLARLVTDPQERQRHIDACAREAARISDPADEVLAWLRAARLRPAPYSDELIRRGIDAIGRVTAPDEQARLLHLVRNRYTDQHDRYATVQAMTAELARPVHLAYVESAWGEVIDAHLPVLTTGETGVETWTPVVLYARAVDHCRQAKLAGGEPAPRILSTDGSPLVPATGAVIRQLERELAVTGEAPLRPVLGRLVNLDPDSEPAMRRWLAHPSPAVTGIAALLLGEYRGLTDELLEPLMALVRQEDDALRHRARQVLSIGLAPIRTLSRVGAATHLKALSYAEEVIDDEPALAQSLYWLPQSVLFDLPTVLAEWCERAEQGGWRLPEAIALAHTQAMTDPVWRMLLTRLASGSAAVQAVLIQSVARMLYRSRTDEGEWIHDEHARLRMTPQRWAEFWAVTRRLDLDKLHEPPVYLLHPGAVLGAVDAALLATEGELTDGSVEAAAQQLREACAASFGAILTLPEQEALTALYWFGVSRHAEPAKPGSVVAAYHDAVRHRERSGWPWVELLVRWCESLLTESVNDPFDGAPAVHLRSHLLQVTAAAVSLKRDSFRQQVDAAQFEVLLADTLRYHWSFVGRQSAARMLGMLRRGSDIGLSALLAALSDVTEVQGAAMEAIPLLRQLDHRVVADLVALLHHPSSTAAWAAAQLLATIGQAVNLPDQLRAQIIDALADALRDPRAHRTVHFGYTAAAIPEMPELDDTFAEALRDVYRFGQTS